MITILFLEKKDNKLILLVTVLFYRFLYFLSESLIESINIRDGTINLPPANNIFPYIKVT